MGRRVRGRAGERVVVVKLTQRGHAATADQDSAVTLSLTAKTPRALAEYSGSYQFLLPMQTLAMQPSIDHPPH